MDTGSKESAKKTELLSNLKARILLTAYATPRGPSEVARLLELPANTVHYWTKRLLAADMLEVAEKRGRVRSYRSKQLTEACSPEACLPFTQNVMGALSKVVLGAAERRDVTGKTPLPEVGLHELRLTAAQVRSIVTTLKDAMPAPQAESAEDGEVYTVGFVVSPGSVSQYF